MTETAAEVLEAITLNPGDLSAPAHREIERLASVSGVSEVKVAETLLEAALGDDVQFERLRELLQSDREAGGEELPAADVEKTRPASTKRS